VNIYTITETHISPRSTFIGTTVVHTGSNERAAIKAFDKIVDRELPKSKKAFDQPHRTIFTQGGGSKLIVTFHKSVKS